MRHHPVTGESSQEAAVRLLAAAHGDREAVQEVVTKEIAYAISMLERLFWQEVLAYI